MRTTHAVGHLLKPQAAVAMGLPSIYPKDGYTSTKDFSDDLFSIEVSGPEHHQHLSIVDVPGLFHSEFSFMFIAGLHS